MVSSVEAHISGKADDAHRGKVGHDLRDHLPQPDDRDEPTSGTSGSPTLPDLPDRDATTSEAAGRWVLVGTLLFAAVVLVMLWTEGDDQPAEVDESEDSQEAETGVVEPVSVA